MLEAPRKISALAVRSHILGLGYSKGDRVRLRAFFPSKSEHSDSGRKCDFEYPQLPATELAQWSREGRGIYVVANPGGDKDSDIAECRAFFYEHDDLPKHISASLWESLNLPRPTLQVDTGGKSVHSYWVLDKPCTADEWRSLQADLLEYADADRSLKNPSRVMRLAGCFHPVSGEQATLMIEGGDRVSFEALRRVVPSHCPDMPLLATVPSAGDPAKLSWQKFDRDFRVPVAESVPLEIGLSKRSQELINQGTGENRNHCGAMIARDLIGTEDYFRSINQRFTGDAYGLFIQYCQRCPSDDWEQREWDQIWKSAQRDRPGSSVPPDAIDTRIKFWKWAYLKIMAADVVKALPSKGPAIALAEVAEDAPDTEKLKVAIANYNKVCDAGDLFQSVILRNKIARDFAITKSELEMLSRHLLRESESQITSASDVIVDVFEEISERSQSGAPLGVLSQYTQLDSITQGFQRSDLVIVAARPGCGKTAFVMNVARNIAVNEQLPVIIFSIEMSKEQLVYRLLSSEAEIVNTRLRSGRISEQEYGQLGHAIATLTEAQIYLDDSSGIHVAEIKNKLRVFAANHKGSIGAVVIDYLQIMGGIGDDVVNDVAKITRQLKGLARDFDCPFFALSQLNRDVENRTDKRPKTSDLRSSGAIEQDADLILMLFRDEMHNKDTTEKGVAEVIITKHRNGPLGTVRLAFDGMFTKFKNL